MPSRGHFQYFLCTQEYDEDFLIFQDLIPLNPVKENNISIKIFNLIIT